jgi:hypothetical protein
MWRVSITPPASANRVIDSIIRLSSVAVLHVRNDGLLRREFKTSFLQKMLDEGLDFSCQ